MQLTVNGEPVQLSDIGTVGELLDYFRVTHQAVAVMANGEIVAREAFRSFPIKPGDSVEIIRFVGGG